MVPDQGKYKQKLLNESKGIKASFPLKKVTTAGKAMEAPSKSVENRPFENAPSVP